MKNSEFIILDGKGKYPDFYVSMYRLGYDKNVGKVANELDFNVENTAEEGNGFGYVGNINHNQALTLNTKLGGFTLPTLYFADMLYQLIETIKGNRKTYDGDKKEIDSKKIELFYDEITGVRGPWRGEHLDGEFGDNTITYHKFVNGKFQKVTEELEDCLMQDKLPGIDLEDWVKNPNSQGLPRKEAKKGSSYHGFPRDGAAAWFSADSVWAGLSCDGGPRVSYAGLGVRFCAEDTAQKISVEESYTPKQISSALKELNILGLEKQIFEKLRE